MLLRALVVAAMYALHQDLWFWRSARPLVFGFLPVGLFYHAAYTLACSAMLWWLVRCHWPAHLDPSTHVARSGPASSTRMARSGPALNSE